MRRRWVSPGTSRGGGRRCAVALIQRWIGQHYRRFDLAFGYRPVPLEHRRLVLRRHELVAVTLIEADCPLRIRPCSDENAAFRRGLQTLEEAAPHPTALARREHVCVTD